MFARNNHASYVRAEALYLALRSPKFVSSFGPKKPIVFLCSKGDTAERDCWGATMNDVIAVPSKIMWGRPNTMFYQHVNALPGKKMLAPNALSGGDNAHAPFNYILRVTKTPTTCMDFACVGWHMPPVALTAPPPAPAASSWTSYVLGGGSSAPEVPQRICAVCGKGTKGDDITQCFRVRCGYRYDGNY